MKINKRWATVSALFVGALMLLGVRATEANIKISGFQEDTHNHQRGNGHRKDYKPNRRGHYKDRDNHNANPVPEPASLLILGGGALGVAAYRKAKKNFSKSS